MSSPVATRSSPGARVSWQVPGDAFLARRLAEAIPPGRRAGALAHRDGCSVVVVATCAGIERVDLFDDAAAGGALPPGVSDEAALQDVAELVARCLSRWQPDVERLPLSVRGTAFQVDVWRDLRSIAPGRTSSYGEVARRLGRPAGASRAVGQAVGANPVPILVPCHRVLAAGGAIGGFACGLPMKRRLLLAEGNRA